MTLRPWDGAAYDRVGTPQAEWGRRVLERLPLRGDETVLDAGCGSGRVTEMLLERLPAGRVIAVDGSSSMLAAARERLAAHANVEFEQADLLALDLGGRRADAVLSTATFHWIADHERLFERLHAVLAPGGRLVAQCGGHGNIRRVLARGEEVARSERWADRLRGYGDAHHFADAPETEARLRAAGFAEARCWLQDEPTRPPEPALFLATVVFGAVVQGLPADERLAFAEEVIARLPAPFEADYVRLNIDAVA